MKPCPLCAELIQDAAIKCRFCGSMLVQGAVGSPSPAGAVQVGAVLADAHGGVSIAAADAGTVPIHTGSPSWRAQIGAHLWTLLLDVIGIALAVLLPWKLDVAVASALVAAACCWAVGGLWLLYLVLARRTLIYRITNRAIEVESGLLSRRIETTQLWKVRDLELVQSILERILGVARVRVFSRDATDPELVLWGLTQPRDVYEKLKDAVEVARQSRNVVNVVE